MKRALKHWRSWSKHQYHNKHTIKYANTIKAVQIIQIKQCIKYWRYYILSRYQSQKQCIRASAYFSIKQQKQCLIEWNELTQKNIILAMEYDHFIMNKSSKTIQTCFNAWKKELELQQKLIKAAILLNTFSNRLSLFNAFNHWKEEYDHRHSQHGIMCTFNFCTHMFLNSDSHRDCRQFS